MWSSSASVLLVTADRLRGFARTLVPSSCAFCFDVVPYKEGSNRVGTGAASRNSAGRVCAHSSSDWIRCARTSRSPVRANGCTSTWGLSYSSGHLQASGSPRLQQARQGNWRFQRTTVSFCCEILVVQTSRLTLRSHCGHGAHASVSSSYSPCRSERADQP